MTTGDTDRGIRMATDGTLMVECEIWKRCRACGEFALMAVDQDGHFRCRRCGTPQQDPAPTAYWG